MSSRPTRNLDLLGVWIATAATLVGCRAGDSRAPELTPEPMGEIVEAGLDETEAESTSVESGAPIDAPIDATGSYASTIDYLLDRYDDDGDGRVQAAEYARGEEAFGRLDRDGDGALSAADFRVRERGDSADRMRRMGGAVALARYFQSDDDPAVFTEEELVNALVRFDTDVDERVDEAEFTCAYEAHAVDLPDSGMARMVARRMEDSTPWEGVLLADADADGALGFEEAVDFFESTGAARTWRRFAAPEPSRDPERGRRGADRDSGGPPEGERAPDFTLTSLDGESSVTLSSFAGSKPVALVFGSYT